MQCWPFCLAAALAVSPLAAQAQDHSDAELKAILETQIETFRAVREAPDLGPARGLVLAPIEGQPVESVRIEPELAAPAAPGIAAAAPDPADGAAVPELSLAHFILPEAEQLNLRVNFAFDSAAIGESEKPKLRQLCTAMQETGVEHFRIIGHTDAVGDPDYNQRLSVLRAEEVKRFFTDDCGIAEERLEAIGVGKQFPFNQDDPFDGENRRVEFQAMS